MFTSDHDKVAEATRHSAMEDLVNLYIDQHINDVDDQQYGFLNVRGQEVPDPTELEPPLGYVHVDIFEQMRNMVRRELTQLQELQNAETFEESDDFDIEDEMEPISPYELFFNPPDGDPPGPAPDAKQAPPGEPPAAAASPPQPGGEAPAA